MAVDFETVLVTRIRAAVATAGFLTEDGDSETTFEVPFPDNTRLVVAASNGSLRVARVMPSGNVTAQAEFTGFPGDMVITAVVALVTEAY